MSLLQNSRLILLTRIATFFLLIATIVIGANIYRSLLASTLNSFSNKQVALSHLIENELNDTVNLSLQLTESLANSQLLIEFADAPHTQFANDFIKPRILQTFLNAANTDHEIQQIRYIDLEGREQLRVDNVDGIPRIAEDDALQFKGDRYYFTASISSNLGAWASNLDLNIENGIVQIPYQPTIRTVSKVLSGNKLLGIVIINVDKTELMQSVTAHLSHSKSWLINSDGYFLVSPDNKNWGWLLDQQSHNASATFAPVWSTLSSLEKRASTFLNGHQYWGMRINPNASLERGSLEDDYFLVTETPRSFQYKIYSIHILAPVVIVIFIFFIGLGYRTIIHLIQKLEAEHHLAVKHSKAKAEFLARMSHEIRTPINGINGFIQLLEREQQTSQSRLFLKEARSSLKLLTTVIDDILDVSKIEAGKLTLDHRAFDFDETIKTVGKIIGELARGKAINLMFDFDPHRPRNLIGDPVRLQQILLNLTSNAIKFTDQGEVCVQIDILARNQGKVQIGFDVTDTGMGMPASTIEEIFAPFAQGSHNVVSKHGGTGLGLAITKQLVEMMNGEIAIESTEGKGTTVSFNIWLEVDETLEEKTQNHIKLQSYNALILTKHLNTATILRRQCAVLGWPSTLLKTRHDVASFSQSPTPSVAGATIAIVDEYFLSDDIDTDYLNTFLKQTLGIKSILLVSHNFDGYGAEKLTYHDGIVVKPFVPSTLYDAVVTACPPVDAMPSTAPTISPDSKALPLNGITILLAEDNKTNQLVASQILKGLGAIIVIAGDGHEAISALENPDNSFDIVLMDMEMPNLNGIGATEIIRTKPRFDSLPIVALTANAMAEDRLRCIKAGMQEHISKPFDSEEITHTILKLIHSKPSI